MQKGTGNSKNSKSKTNLSMTESYTSPARKKFSEQSIRQFKIEIDHEIAKCLDTLDRQGLKFLKQTLRTSNMFNSTNFQVENQNAKYESENSRINLDKPENVKIPHQILNKYYDSKCSDQIKENQNSRKKESPKKKSKPQSSHRQQEKTQTFNNQSKSSKHRSSVGQMKSQKQEIPTKGKNDSMHSQVQKDKYVSQFPNKSFNKNNQSSSSARINQTKQAYNQVQQSQKSQKPKEEKKYQSVQAKSSAQIKQRQIPASQNSNSRVVKKTVIENKKTNEKISLGQRLSKKMEELHISKVGPTKKTSTQAKTKIQNTTKKVQNAKQTPNMPEETIEEEIIEGFQAQIQQYVPNESNIHESIVTESIIQESFNQNSVGHEQSIKISQKINPLKPVVKDLKSSIVVKQQEPIFKKSQTLLNQHIQLRNQAQSLVDESKVVPNQLSSMNPQQSLIQKLSMSIQVDNTQIDQNSYENSLDKEKFVEMSHIVDKINKLSPHKLLQVQKYIEFIEKTPQQQFKSPYSNIPSQIQTNEHAQSNLLDPQQARKNDLNKNKSQTFQNNWVKSENVIKRPITKLQRQDHFTQKESVNPNNSKPPLSIYRNDSRKGNRQKKEKASMIFNSNSKSASRSRIKIDPDFEQEKEPKESNFKKQQKLNSQKPYIKGNSSYVSQGKGSQNVILAEEKPIRMEKIDYKEPQKYLSLTQETNHVMRSSQMNLSKVQKDKIDKNQNNVKIEAQAQSNSKQLKEQKKLQLRNSQLILSPQIPKNQQDESIKPQETNLNIEYTEVKMLNVSNKRSMIKEKEVVEERNRTKLKFRIISNRGHPSLFGLTGIQLFTIDNKRVQISETQLGLNSASTSKLLNLFNGNHYLSKEDQFYQSPLNKNQIIVELDKQNDKIGGILIFNFNKSSLESEKEVDQMEIYHNDAKVWKGTINKGADSQIIEYATKIQFIPNFAFPPFQIPNRSFVMASNFSKDTKTSTKIAIDKPSNQSKLIESKPQHQIFNEKKIGINNSRLGYKSNSPVKQQRQPALGYERQRKVIDQPKAEKQQTQSQISTKNFKFSDSIENLNKWNSKNDNKTNNINVPPVSNQNIVKTQRKPTYDQFDSMLNGLEQHLHRQKSKSKIPVNPTSKDFQNSQIKNISTVQNKPKQKISNNNKQQFEVTSIKKTENKTTSQQIQDFVNASIFKDKSKGNLLTVQKRSNSPPENQDFKIKPKQNFEQKEPTKNKDINIDDFLGQLQDVMKNKGSARKNKVEKQIQIPNLPQGSFVQVQISQNWGHQAFVGVQAIQFFDKEGKILTPIKIESNKNHQNLPLIQTLNSKNIISRDQKIQTKLGFDRNAITNLSFTFSSAQPFSLIRVWNYKGHRVHSNIGIKLCTFKIDGRQVFLGEIKRNQSTPQNFHKHFDAILFTNDVKIIKKIKQNDWLTELKNKTKTQKELFKSTLINFNRPKTRNSENKNSSKENQEITLTSKNQKEIKLPKRQCWQYEPPEMPEGNFLVFLLHDTWGDQNFIGLNGLQIFDGEGRLLGKEKIAKIRAFPNSTGEKNDKRVIENLINGSNLSSIDTNIWLSTYQSDIEKIETGKPNMIIVELSKRTRISGINIYNYSKTPQRGVRELQIQVNNMIAFRGYVKMFDQKSGDKCFHTTINFTKNVEILSNMNYEAYNEDNIDQNVAYVNERKTVKA